MKYVSACAKRGASLRAGASVGGRRRRSGVIGFAILAAASVIPAGVLLTVCATSASLAARSVLGSDMPTTIVSAVRTDMHRQLASRGFGIPDQDDLPPDQSLADARSAPTDARTCGGAEPAARAVRSPEFLGSAHAPEAGDLVPVGRDELTAPCLTDEILRTAAFLLPATGLLPMQGASPAFAVVVALPDNPKQTAPGPEHTGSIPPAASPAQRARREEARGHAALAALDGRTALYDIVARTVYLPDGTRLEAHSGLGSKRDDPRFVHVKMQGATPPNVYDLKMREALFHGVRAIRLNPVAGSKMFGRDGILAHTYMLGPNGQSNGCVSFRNYPAFLQAFLDGKVKRIVVAASLPAPPTRAMLRGAGGDQIALAHE
jgi:hypothetical protein